MSYQPVFPAALQPTASALWRQMAATESAPARQACQVLVGGEPLSPPARVYWQSDELHTTIAAASGDVRTLALCLGTRHHDGRIREACLRQLMPASEYWIAPFIVLLLGEYVIEIVEKIAAELTDEGTAQLSAFARENPSFMALARQRATSYWDCYHRHRFTSLQSYPAITVLNSIELGVRSA